MATPEMLGCLHKLIVPLAHCSRQVLPYSIPYAVIQRERNEIPALVVDRNIFRLPLLTRTLKGYSPIKGCFK